MIRNPAVAGHFYSGTKSALSKEIESLVGKTIKKEEVIGVVSPHAGYMYSGAVAAGVLAVIKPKPTYIIMGPNHTGMGESFGITASDTWNTPLGDVRIDKALADQLKKNCKYLKGDELSHAHEHSIEVQVPFLQFLQKSFKIVPIVISYANPNIYKEIGHAMARSILDLKMEKDVVIIASSDMTHYESQEEARKKDSAAIEAILELDADKLVKRVAELDISMCGYAPAVIMITAAKELGAKSGRLVKYATSGDASGDYSSVVGYAGIVIK